MAAEEPKSVQDPELDAFIRELARIEEEPVAAPEPWAQRFDASRFRVVRRLGAGGFGVVYLVQDLATDAAVALKALPVPRPELIYRLKREFRALADIRHENLVSFYELFADGGNFCFTMEYVPGTTFLEHVRRGPVLDERRLREALAQLTAGLSTLHASGKLHRDVKPSNVLVTPQERVVLLDFGLATEMRGRPTTRAESSGTPPYMSPEHAVGEPLSESSDWYSVGIMLYQALTGRLPFRIGPRGAEARRRASFPSPRDAGANVPESLSCLCMSLLEADPARRPGSRDILAILGDRPASLPRRTATSARLLLGREPELAVLETALSRVRAGNAATVLVDGNSGVGKTALVEQFMAGAEKGERSLVLRGRCYERERVPYQGIDSLVDELCGFLDAAEPATAEGVLPRHVSSLVRLFPVLERVAVVSKRIEPSRSAPADDRETRREAFRAFRELLARIAQRHTLVVHVDDLQWGDPDAAMLLREVIRPPDAPPMLLVLAYRSEDCERSPCLRALEQEDALSATRVHLGPLSDAASRALLRSLLDDRRADLDVDLLARESGGNPFLLHEIARHAAQCDATAGSSALDVKTVLRHRCDRLPPAAQLLLQTVAIAGQPVTEPVVRRAAAFRGPAWEAWRLLVSERLVRFSGPPDERCVEPFHDRIRESVVAGLAPERKRELHGGLAEALESVSGADLEALAQHHEGAGNRERARALAVQAAAKATKALAFDRAARLLGHAILLTPPERPERSALHAALGDALSNAGRCVEAAGAFLEAASGETEEARVRLRRRAAEQLMFAGRIDEGRDLFQSDLRAHGFAIARTRGRAIASLLLRRAFVGLRGLGFHRRDAADVDPELLRFLRHVYSVSLGLDMVDSAYGGDIGTRFLLRALDVGEPHLVGRGLVVLAGFATAERPLARGTDLLVQRLKGLADGLKDPALDGTVAVISAFQGYFAGDWKSGLRHADEADRIIREEAHGLVWEQWTARAIAIWSLFPLGRWGELERRVHAGRREARERGNVYGAAGVCAPFGVAAWLARDQPEEARRTLLDVVGTWSATGFQLQHYWFLEAELLLDLYAGDGVGAWARLCKRWKPLAGSLTLRFPIVRVKLFHMRGTCALAAAAQTQPGSAAQRSLLDEAERAARRLGKVRLPVALPLADLLWSGAAAQRGDLDAAARRLESAATKLDAVATTLYAAAARRRLARLRGESPPEFLPGESIADPDAVMRMLVPELSRR